MIVWLRLCLMLCMIQASAVYGQSIFFFKYELEKNSNPVIYHALMVRNEDGSGLMRVRFLHPADGSDVMVELQLKEHLPKNLDRANEPDEIYITGSNPLFVMGNKQKTFDTPVFIFSKTDDKGNYDPATMGLLHGDSLHKTGTLLAKETLTITDLTRDFVALFFGENEPFAASLFQTSTRNLSAEEKKIKMYLVAVADTNDPYIGSACAKDILLITETFEKVASFLGIQFVAKQIVGAQYNKRNVELALQQLRPSNADIVIFYYSGHGFRKRTDNRDFPYLDLRANKKENYLVKTLNIEDIYNSIRKKGARLNLIISDCCNDTVTATNSVGTPVPATKVAGFMWSLDNCKALFLNPTPRSYLMTAADRGQLASSNQRFGSFFSYYFRIAMQGQFSRFKKGVSWDQIFQEARKNTITKAQYTYCSTPGNPKNICKQFPRYTTGGR